MTSLRHLTKLINASKINLTSSQICIIRLSSCDSKVFLRQFDYNQIQVIRTVRTGNGRGPTSSSDPPPPPSEDENSFNNKSNLPPNIKNIDPATLKKLKIFSLVVLCSTFGLSFLALRKMGGGGNPAIAEAMKAEPIEFDEFLEHILPTGEIQRVVYVPHQQRAIAFLQPGAMIHGKSYTSDVIPIRIERQNPSQPDQVRLEIRHAEEKLGLPLTEGIPVDTFRGPSFFRAMEFFIGFVIIGFLASRYGQLIRRQILQKRAEDAAAKAAGKKM
uniref:Uncharacterized protein n=1 Tax=Panagrolaimus superbus TaxID=310955 RepID=A0A914YK14_9BILA